MSRSPLAGRTIVVTRPREQSEELVALLEKRGARALVAPAIEILPAPKTKLQRTLHDLAAGEFAWLVVTSRAGVEAIAANVRPRDIRANVAAIGEGTAEAFRRWARRDPELVPRTFTTAALARAMPRGQGRVLLARADIAPAGLEDALTAKGWTPERVDAYRTRRARSLPAEARRALGAGEVDAITFTSASTVDGFLRVLSGLKGDPKVVCIGPVTARAARDAGLRVSAVSRPHTIEGVVAALERVFAPSTATRG